jgi:hypothetical protein
MANTPAVAPPGQDQFSTATTANNPTTITGDGTSTDTASASADTPTPLSSVAPLGAPLGNVADGGVTGAAPAPAPFAPGGGQSVPGGASAGAGGSVGTSPASAQADADPQAKYADNGRSTTPYVSTGFAPATGGGRNPNGADPSINPKDLMAAMMGQMGEKKDDPQGGTDIREYRSIASDTPFAPLPKNEEVFGYIHKAYQGLQRKHRVGLN